MDEEWILRWSTKMTDRKVICGGVGIGGSKFESFGVEDAFARKAGPSYGCCEQKGKERLESRESREATSPPTHRYIYISAWEPSTLQGIFITADFLNLCTPWLSFLVQDIELLVLAALPYNFACSKERLPFLNSSLIIL